MIVLGLLDHVAADDGLVAVIAILRVGDEVGLAEELLLVMLEFSDHFDRQLFFLFVGCIVL